MTSKARREIACPECGTIFEVRQLPPVSVEKIQEAISNYFGFDDEEKVSFKLAQAIVKFLAEKNT